jgi:hypothetical protein
VGPVVAVVALRRAIRLPRGWARTGIIAVVVSAEVKPSGVAARRTYLVTAT